MFTTVEKVDKLCPRSLDVSLIDTTTKREQWLTAPFNDSCLLEIFNRMSAQLQRYYGWEELLYTGLYVLTSLLAIVGNGIVVLAVARNRKMRTNRNILIVNLALSNL